MRAAHRTARWYEIAADMRPVFNPAISLVFACLASFALSWARLHSVWGDGAFYDSDDAMRMVEVRDWLAGQGWFDMVAHRLSPPAGLAMHWSRIIDVPLGFLVLAFDTIASPIGAERLARITFPLICQMLLITAFARAARLLCGSHVIWPALAVIVLNGFQFLQFMPGRIDHHGPQIVLLMTFVGMAIAGLKEGGRSSAIGCAAAIALSLGISLENLPFIAVTLATLAGAWIWRGDPMGQFLRAFGIGLAILASIVFAATVPPHAYEAIANDRFSAPHLIICLIAGSGFSFATMVGSLRRTLVRRCCTMLGIAVFILIIVPQVCPGFPTSPYAAVDPLVREIWLRHVSEALPLAETVSEHPSSIMLVLVPIVSGLVAAIIAWRLSPEGVRAAWGYVVGLIATGIAGALWETRVASSVAPLAALGGAWITIRASAHPGTGLIRRPAVRVLLVLWPFCPVLCALLPVPSETSAATPDASNIQACRAPAALRPLATLEPGLAFAPIDLGAQILAFTDLSVIGAPYHRNNAGNRTVLDILAADPASAAAQLRADHFNYVLFCPGNLEMAEVAARSPGGFAAGLLAGRVPVGLQRLALEPTPYVVYRVQ